MDKILKSVKCSFIRMANKMGWGEVTEDNFDDEMPYSMHYCHEAVEQFLTATLEAKDKAINTYVGMIGELNKMTFDLEESRRNEIAEWTHELAYLTDEDIPTPKGVREWFMGKLEGQRSEILKELKLALGKESLNMYHNGGFINKLEWLEHRIAQLEKEKDGR